MEYHVKKFSKLTVKELFEIMKLRVAVFVVEQNCSYQEIDAADETAIHTWLQEGSDVVGYTRIIEKEEFLVIGRVLVNPAYRGKELGKLLLKNTLTVIKENYPSQPIMINAQVYLTDFYRSFGFEVISEEYLEDGILHVQMKKQAT